MMTRISLMLVAVAVASGMAGCAQCDTCDDFPAPCVGPNCGQNQPGIMEMMGSNAPQGAPMMAPPTTTNPSMIGDSAGPAPAAPMPSTPSVNPSSPPSPMDPIAKP